MSTRELTMPDGLLMAESDHRADDALRTAFEEQVLLHWDSLWRFAYRMVRTADDAEDLLSEALLEGFKSFDRFRGSSSFTSWMFRILTTTRIDSERRSVRRKADCFTEIRESDWMSVADHREGPEESVVGPMLSESVEKALRALPAEYRAIVILVDLEEMEYEEVSRTLRIPIGTVRSRLHRARARLRQALQEPPRDGSVS